MRHVIRYEGGFERNFATLQPDATEYVGDDGQAHPLPTWPADATGMRYGYMEQPGKRFVVVRVRYGDDEVLLRHPVRLDPARHMGARRFSPEPVLIADGPAGELLGDIISANQDQKEELSALREKIRGTIRAAKAH